MIESLFVSLLLASTLLSLAPDGTTESKATRASEARWLGPEGTPLPFETDEEIISFLKTAEVISQKELTGGINRPLKMRLRQNGVEANAIFRIVDIRQKRAKLDGKIVPDFHDSYIYECAAWEVSRLLGIDSVPPCTERRFDLHKGTIQLWVEDSMTEVNRREKNIRPPEQLKWMRQRQTMRLFDALIYNFDRNQGNMLIDANWKLWFIDHTRSFRKSAVVEKIERIIWCEREIFRRIQELDKKTLSHHLKSKVTGVQITMLLKRRDRLVNHLNRLMDETSEGAVLWDQDGPVDQAVTLPAMLDDDIPETSSIVIDADSSP